jgi:hypothetical protein
LPSFERPILGLAWAGFKLKKGKHIMSKHKRHTDNSKRQQPVQQQRAEAARLASSQAKATKREQETQKQERASDQDSR